MERRGTAEGVFIEGLLSVMLSCRKLKIVLTMMNSVFIIPRVRITLRCSDSLLLRVTSE